MIALDEDALLCDMAETYHIYQMEQLPAEYVATLAIGLRPDSRIKMKANGLKVSPEMLIFARIADNTAINAYAVTKDAKTGRNRPKSLLKALTTDLDDRSHAKQYDSGSDFLDEWRTINGN